MEVISYILKMMIKKLKSAILKRSSSKDIIKMLTRLTISSTKKMQT